MKLVRLAKAHWEVLAACDDRGRCELLEFLSGLTGSYEAAAREMTILLLHTVALNGPPKAEPWCKPLGWGLFEFRRQPKGKKLRVVWYYGGKSVIVCTAGFTKGERTPRNEIERSLLHQERYKFARGRGILEIIELE